jgi:transcriptional regulator of acetoin/glycerol metabolism
MDKKLSAAWKLDKSVLALEQAFARVSGNISLAAPLLGVSRRTLYRQLADRGINLQQLRQSIHG